jgi:alginate O-acetyltransferase complex protein AlgI
MLYYAVVYFFYAWGAPKFIFVLLGTTIIDFYVVRFMSQQRKKAPRTLFMCFSLCINLGLNFCNLGNGFIEQAYDHYYPQGMKIAKK